MLILSTCRIVYRQILRLDQHLRARQQEQIALYETVTAISPKLDADLVFHLLAERLTVVLNATSTRVASLEAQLREATIVAQYHTPQANQAERANSQGYTYDLGDLPRTLTAIQAQQPLLMTKTDAPDEWKEALAQRDGQLLLLPLAARGRAIGFAELWDSTNELPFTQDEITLGQILTNQAAIAIENAHLLAETQRHLGDLTLLYDIAVAADLSLDLDTILQSVVRMLQHALGAETVRVMLMELETETLQTRACVSRLKDQILAEQASLSIGIYRQVAQAGQPILVDDAREVTDLSLPDRNSPIHSVLVVPLLTPGQRVIGVLGVESQQKRAFTNQDLRLLRIMTGHLARSIENVRLFAQLKRSREGLVLRNRALEQANERLKELDRLKSTFVASVSHELRTPLNSIIGFSEVLIDGLVGELGSTAQEYLSYIHTSGTHLRDLINDILDLSKLQAGRMTLALEQVDIIDLIKEVHLTLAPLIEKKSQRLEIHQAGPIPQVTADRFRLKQVLINLLSNANKFTPPEGQIVFQASLLDPVTLRLDVIDNGRGVPLEEQSIIFEEFRQARTTSQPGEGTGLGLAISRRLVELHGGRIWVESHTEPGEGSKFTVLLPVAGPSPSQSKQSNSPQTRD